MWPLSAIFYTASMKINKKCHSATSFSINNDTIDTLPLTYFLSSAIRIKSFNLLWYTLSKSLHNSLSANQKMDSTTPKVKISQTKDQIETCSVFQTAECCRPNLTSKCNASSHQISIRIATSTIISFPWMMMLSRWLAINQQYPVYSFCIVVDCLPKTAAMISPSGCKIIPLETKPRQYLSNNSPTPSTNKNRLANHTRFINILKTPTAPQSLSNMHLNHCILQISFKD